ncbi:MAG: phospholipid carrier-dependent glycosyltransferase [Asgard group archaeon]|nr:phospholipid carrier-dependent glycosyltransferase [Asgard group archaeon]
MAKKVSTPASKVAAKQAAIRSRQQEDILTIDPLVDPVFQKGSVREFLVTEPSTTVLKKRLLGNKEYWMLSSLLIIALYVRMYKLSYPNSVVFDEVHFGGFARKYILGTFFMDVHPPLAKMLFGAVGTLGGFKGDFDFKSIGDKFPETTPYVFMRQFPALLGIGTVILCYLTLRQSGVRPIVAYATSFLLIIENFNVTISRYILLDSPLLFFIAAAVYAWKKFEIQVPFTFAWYKSLIATGIALGLALSSKWVGLFTVAWVGLLCIYQMWFLIGDLSVNTKKIVHHFFARGLILLGVPMTLYLAFFAVHFQLLYKEGDGGAFMTPAFRSTLQGNKIPKNIVEQVGLGSIVTIRHMDTRGGYLHSHDHFYKTGSKQQQITLYPHLDSNNKWLIEPYNGTVYNETFVPLINGMKIRLKHINTGRRLHSHDEKPPVSERDWQKEASCYGYEGFSGDANDDWVVEIVGHRSQPGDAQAFVKSLNTVFRLRHAMTGHYLFSSEVKLPDWGFGQQEVTAASQGKRHLTHWYIETNENSYLPKSEVKIVNYPKLSLWQKFVESHKRMWKINQGLTSHHHWQSSPTEWPFLLRGINYWNREHRQVYLLGNAVTWWAATLSVAGFAIYAVVTVFKFHLGTPLSTDKHIFNFNTQVLSYTLGWAIHYAPFFLMGRQLFLHHYQPALYFGILALGHVFDVIVGYLGSRNRALQNFGYFLVLGTSVLSLVFYIYYSPLIYATPWTKDRCLVSKPFKTWDYDCNTFLSQLSEYKNIEASSSSELATPTETVVAQTKGSNKKAAKKEEPHASPAAEVKEEKIIKEEQLAPPLPDEETPKKNDAPQVAEVDSSSNDAEQAEIKEQAKEEAAPVVEEVVAEEPVAEKVEEIKEQVVEKVEDVREPVAEKVEEVREQVAEAVEEAKEPVVEKVEEVKQQVEEPVVEKVEEVKQQVEEPVVEKVEEVKEQVSEKVEEVKEQVKEAEQPVEN